MCRNVTKDAACCETHSRRDSIGRRASTWRMGPADRAATETSMPFDPARVAGRRVARIQAPDTQVGGTRTARTDVTEIQVAGMQLVGTQMSGARVAGVFTQVGDDPFR